MADVVGAAAGVAGAVLAVPSAINYTMDLVKRSNGCNYASDIDLSGVPISKFFYMTSVDGERFLACDGKLDGDSDPIPTAKTITGKHDMTNNGIRFVFKNGQLYCQGNKFKHPVKVHAFGRAQSDDYVFAAWDAHLSNENKYQWDMVEIEGKVGFKSCHDKGFLTGEITGYKGRICTTASEEDAYVALYLSD